MLLCCCAVVFWIADATPHRDSVFGRGTGPIYLGALGCVGTETRLVDCPSGSTDMCTHSNEAGVTCSRRKSLVLILQVIFRKFLNNRLLKSDYEYLIKIIL